MHKTPWYTNQRKSVLATSEEDVFCLTTQNGTFIARQGGETFITGNCQYGAGVETIARAAGVTKAVATELREAYKTLNWSIEKIASLTVLQQNYKYGTWQYNPISKLWYSLRSDKDRFSTLVQGSGAYVLDMWLYIIRQECMKRRIDFRLLGQFHDELILEVDDQDMYEIIVRGAIEKLSKSLALNRGLDCGVDFGKDYSEIH